MSKKCLLMLGTIVMASSFLAPSVHASEATLQGRVVTPDGRTAIKNLPVIIRGQNGSVVATTNEDGRYEVHALPPGSYEVLPANEPELKQDVVIESDRRVWEFWKRDTGRPVMADDINIDLGKRW